MVGLVICSFGTYLSIRADIGLAPWDAFSMGVSNALNLPYGTIVAATGCVVLLVDLVMKEKIGLGTVLDIAIVGKSIDFFLWLDPVAGDYGLGGGVAAMALAQLAMAFGIYVYMSAALSCGPRDALMMGIGKRLKKLPVGVVRSLIEGVALAMGWMLHAKVGIGTIMAVFGLGICIQIVFSLAKFDAKAIEHLGFAEMLQTAENK